jgi:uncharacterized lipoprotein YddW (UPF0748 family)
MNHRSLILAVLALASGASPALVRDPTPPPPVPREFRGAWVTALSDRGLRDWPSVPGLSPDSQRAELRALLDHAAAVGLNAVILHVRLAGDAMYPTKYAPWSPLLNGTSGVGPSPAYDPLEFAVSEAHARGLQLHAWFNPFRALLTSSYAGNAALSQVTRAHPEWIRKYGSQTWIDPGIPAARKFVLETILDVAKRYDVDGIHLDDYFYPYQETRTITRRVHRKRVRAKEVIPFPDDKSWRTYGKGHGFTDRDAWRRANIDDFIHSLYVGVKAIKPSIVVGISPFGIWRSGTPHGVTGLDAFSEIYADSRKWLTEGWLDYLAPQLYWEIGGEEDRFRALDAWWRSENVRHRNIWPGLYSSRVIAGSGEWPLESIGSQIDFIRESRLGTADAPGHVHFRLAALFANGDRLARSLATFYQQRALVPAYPWLGDAVPGIPVVTLVPGDSTESFTVVPGDSTPVRWWLIQTRGTDGLWSTTLRSAGEGKLSAAAFGTVDPDEIAVTAVSPTGVTGQPAVVTP